MKHKRLIASMLIFVIMLAALSACFSAYAIVTCETQYSYDEPNASWLKDLTMKEDMLSVQGLTERSILVAKASYPYRKTADSFKQEIAYYEKAYTLDSDMTNAAYLYVLQVTELFASATETEYSDDYIKGYLTDAGLVYPNDNSETKIVARAVFAIMQNNPNIKFTKGTGLYEAFVSYASTVFGISQSTFLKFDADAVMSGLDDYVLAGCKYALYHAGYNVDKNTSNEEVYRLIAIMTIKAQGISIDEKTASFSEVKSKYLCAMMCKIYSVSGDTTKFDNAVKNNNLAFYMLQLIGKENGVAVKDGTSYNDAFNLVCKNTKYFNLIDGEFYADIAEYDVHLKYKRSSVWMFPESVNVTSESDGMTVTVSINGTAINNGFYNEVKLDKTKSVQTATITVDYSDKAGTKKSSTYKINVYQGEAEAPSSASSISGALSGVTDTVKNVLQNVGADSSFADIVTKIPFELPKRVVSLVTLLLPSFDTENLGNSLLATILSYSKKNDSNVQTNQIGGVGGLDTYMATDNSALSLNFNASSPSVQTIAVPETTTTPANALVLNDGNGNNQGASTIITGESSSWIKELFKSPLTVVVIIVILVSTFIICFVLFSKLIKERNEAVVSGIKKEKKKKKEK